MVGYNAVRNSIEPPRYKDKDIIDVQDTQDIINDIIFCFKNYNDQARPVASKFKTGTIEGDAKLIWSFIKTHISYVAEPEKFQTTRSFTRIIHDKYGDCKHSALLASSIAWNLGYNIIFRFVGYDRGASYGHVYTLIESPRTGERVVIDPLQPFNTEKHFFKKVDYKATNNLKFHPMLSRLTGTDTVHANVPRTSAVTMRGVAYVHPDETRMVVGSMEIIMSPSVAGPEADTLDGLCGIGKRSPSQRKEARQQTKAARKETRAVKKDARQEKRVVKKEARQVKRADKKQARVEKRAARGGSVVKKISLAPVRGAFSALLLVNARGLASRLSQALTINEPEVKKFAAKLGYKFDVLKSQILKGGKKKPLLGSKIHGVVHQVDGIGVVVTTAAFTAAAPAILLAMALFKSLGIGGEGSASDSSVAEEATKVLEGGDTNISVDSSGGSSPGGGGGGIDTSGSGGEMIPSGGGGGSASPGGGGDATSSGMNDFINSKTMGLPTPLVVIGTVGLLYYGAKKFKIF